METKDSICGNGMCPYVACKDYPNCKHVKQVMEEN